jgi:iron complex outermembrane receptor protein
MAGGIWISPRLKFRASASRAFRVPSYTDLYYHDPANLGSPTLRPESAWTYEGGLDLRLGARAAADITVFERRERNGIDYFRSGPSDIWRALNIQNLNFTGVEASLRLRSLDFRYTGLRGVQDTIPDGFTKYTFNYPVHSGVIAYQGMVKNMVVLRTRIGVLSRRARDPYAVWDAYAAMTRGRIHPFVQLTNLTDTMYQEVLGVRMPGRTVIGGFELLLRGH